MSTKSSKNELQEFCDGMRWDHPRYETVEEGPNFVVRVEVHRGNQDSVSAVGEHMRKKEAGKVAARILLEKLMSGSPADAQMSEPSGQISEELTEGASPLNFSWGSHSPKSAKNFINYRAQLHLHCQQNNLTVSYDEVENVQNLRRFSTKLTIEGNPNPKVGSGDSKNEAKEEAAKQMWESLQPQENGSTTTASKNENPPKILYKYPVTIGIQDFDPLPPLNLDPNSNGNVSNAEFDSESLPNLNNLNVDPDDEKNENLLTINGDYIQALTDKFQNTDMRITFVPIPFETIQVSEYFYFVSVGGQGEVPRVAGHGKGLSEEAAKNAAAKDCLGLCLDEVSTEKCNNVINNTNLS